MQEKLEQILSDATDWMTAAEIADQGKWRSAANVGLALKQMGSVECRTSPTKLGVNGKPIKEFRLAGERVDQSDKTLTPSTHTKALRERIEQLEQDVSKQRALLDAKRDEIELLNDDIRRHIQRAEAAERNRDDAQQLSEENHRLFLAAIRDLASINQALELDPNDGGAEPIIEAFAEIRATLCDESAEADRLRAENLALKTLNESMPGFGATVRAIGSGPFVVRIPGKPAVFASKYDNAKAAAMSAARGKRGGEVFALIPLGKAIRGAEWREKA